MGDVQILWDLEDDPDGNVQHMATNGVTVEEYVEVFAWQLRTGDDQPRERQADLFRVDFDRKASRGCLG